ncbi:CheB methylesterase domain-containing protein [Algirhabdus cladophorae]|uniref:CheB methylesterase domain-containing protein n=1 Tax=Algirhabdus cladophorae TaxID=3377108 RepID=UPI003B849C0A
MGARGLSSPKIRVFVTDVYIISSSTVGFQNVLRAMRRSSGLRFLGRSETLSAARRQIEYNRPSVILISSKFLSDPDFEAATTLFLYMEVRWLVFEDEGCQQHAVPLRKHRSDLFVIPLNATQSFIEHQIAAVCHAHWNGGKSEPPASRNEHIQKWNKSVFIGSSTGGIGALISILKTYPKICPPTVIVQHTGTQFIPSLVNLLNSKTASRVECFSSNTALKAGHIYLAGGSRQHLEITVSSQTQRGILTPPGPKDLHVPSIDTLFSSASKLAENAIGVLLTGMGKDGSVGLGKMRAAGACTIVQDEKTSTIYGMPKIAWETGAAEFKLPIQNIGPKILESAQTKSSLHHAGRIST